MELQETWHVFMFVKTKGTRKNVISVAFTLKRLIPIKKVEGSPLLNTILHPVISGSTYRYLKTVKVIQQSLLQCELALKTTLP